MKANSMIYSATGGYAVELKRELTDGHYSTVTYKKDDKGLLMVETNLKHHWDEIQKFLVSH